ncbi:MAG: hypothetical protein ACI8Q1_002588 [Parvicella sp.]
MVDLKLINTYLQYYMTARIYKCFIASPADTQEERDLCDKVFEEINKNLGAHLNFRVESIKWEKDTRPSFGSDGQDVINHQILKDYELFIGIMWKKFGTPTLRAESGTEEEFNNAYEKYNKDGNVEIMLYFNSSPLPQDFDLDQYCKVKTFKKKVSELGALYNTYNGTAEFEPLLRDHISNYFIELLGKKDESDSSADPNNILRSTFEKKLNDALCAFSAQPTIWLEPILSSSNEISQNPDENHQSKVVVNDLFEEPKSIIIKSPPQFGLTCLSHFLVKEAWNKGQLWLQVDAKEIKRNSVEKAIELSLSELKQSLSEVKCIILDSWSVHLFGAMKLLKNLCNTYKDIPIIVMQTIDDNKFTKEANNEVISREFDVLHLLALPRTQIRKVVSHYNNKVGIGEEDVVLDKIISDLNNLNIHRTPYNCLTLLKVSERYFDESPVNRTRMIEMILIVLFDLGEIPTYKTKPDMKDCEYVLGRFCEKMIKSENYCFALKDFIANLISFCDEKLIELDVQIVFDIMVQNNIIVQRDTGFEFRSFYWIYYFGAKRMHVDKSFCDYIFENKKYVECPEIIEFYTGIDRNREDALKILKNDLNETRITVEGKLGLPMEMNPFKLAQWHPSDENIAQIQKEISQDVMKSSLPEEVKDQHADRTYNQLQPYNQSIQKIFEEYSVVILMQKIKATSRALRNSDYVDPDLKREVLNMITQGWEQLSKVLLALTPILASKGRAAFEGADFELAGDFGETFEQRVNRIIQVNPTNVVGIFRDDLFSNKMGPLLFDVAKNETNELRKHTLMLLLVFERPSGWKEQVQKYIIDVSKNSFYLYDIVNALRSKYRFSFADEKELNEMAFLIKMGLAKHEFGEKKPNLKSIQRINNENLPVREVVE